MAALAQQAATKVRRIGVLMSGSADDPDALAQISFAQGLQERGWSVGGNVRIDYRWGAGNVDGFRKYAAELVALAPDVILATAGSIVAAPPESAVSALLLAACRLLTRGLLSGLC